jgi:hypothetical protein
VARVKWVIQVNMDHLGQEGHQVYLEEKENEEELDVMVNEEFLEVLALKESQEGLLN